MGIIRIRSRRRIKIERKIIIKVGKRIITRIRIRIERIITIIVGIRIRIRIRIERTSLPPSQGDAAHCHRSHRYTEIQTHTQTHRHTGRQT